MVNSGYSGCNETQTEGTNEMKITADSVLAEVSDLAEAKAIARDMRATALSVEMKYGMDHVIAKEFSNRYFAFIDAMAEKFI